MEQVWRGADTLIGTLVFIEKGSGPIEVGGVLIVEGMDGAANSAGDWRLEKIESAMPDVSHSTIEASRHRSPAEVVDADVRDVMGIENEE